MSAPVFVSDSMDGYAVVLDGITVGKVRKVTRRWNIAPRPITTVTWTAWNADDRATPLGKGYGTRREAVAAILASRWSARCPKCGMAAHAADQWCNTVAS